MISFQIAVRIQSVTMPKPISTKKTGEQDAEDERKTFSFDAIDGKGSITTFSVMGHMWDETYQQLEMDKVYLFKNVKVRPVANYDPEDLDIYEYVIDDNTSVELVEADVTFANNTTIKFHTLSEVKRLDIGKTISMSYSVMKFLHHLTLYNLEQIVM